MVKLQYYRNKHSLTVPKEVILDCKFNPGDKFIVTSTTDKETIMFRKIKFKE